MDIYGRRVSATGVPIGGDFRISGPGATADERAPAVAWNEIDNRYLVVWADRDNSSTAAPTSTGDGWPPTAPAGRDFRISGDGAASDEGTPAVAWNATANEFLVVWWRDSGDQRALATTSTGGGCGAGGLAIGTEFRISGDGATSDEYAPAVAWNGAGNRYLVVWNDNRDLYTRGVDVYGRLVKRDGTAVGTDFRVSSLAATQDDESPAVVSNQARNQYLVVWHDQRDSVADVFGRRLSG